jgi:hypothetical protein
MRTLTDLNVEASASIKSSSTHQNRRESPPDNIDSDHKSLCTDYLKIVTIWLELVARYCFFFFFKVRGVKYKRGGDLRICVWVMVGSLKCHACIM